MILLGIVLLVSWLYFSRTNPLDHRDHSPRRRADLRVARSDRARRWRPTPLLLVAQAVVVGCRPPLHPDVHACRTRAPRPAGSACRPARYWRREPRRRPTSRRALLTRALTQGHAPRSDCRAHQVNGSCVPEIKDGDIRLVPPGHRLCPT